MDAIQMIKERRSIRKYRNEKVSKEDIKKIMEAAKFTQSWANTQTSRFTFIQNEEVIEKIGKDGVNDFIYNMKTLKYAKNVVVLSYVKGISGKKDEGYATSKGGEWEVFDAGIACQTFALAAHAYGVGTCVMGIIDDAKIAEIINLPENESVAALITFGYPIEEGNPTTRLPLDELIKFID